MSNIVVAAELRSHSDWVTGVAVHSTNPHILVSCSRDCSIIVWNTEENSGFVEKMLHGHDNVVQSVCFDNDGNSILSSSWDGTMNLWDLETGAIKRKFENGHTHAVLDAALSLDNRMIVSVSRDRTIKLWNTLGELKLTIAHAHSDVVTCIAVRPDETSGNFMATGSWDGTLKVWNISTQTCSRTISGSHSSVNCIAISPDGSLIVSGDRTGKVALHDLNEGQILKCYQAKSPVHAVAYSPVAYWLFAATADGIMMWDLEQHSKVALLKPDNFGENIHRVPVQAISMCFSTDGSRLYAGYTDGVIRVWSVPSAGSFQAESLVQDHLEAVTLATTDWGCPADWGEATPATTDWGTEPWK